MNWAWVYVAYLGVGMVNAFVAVTRGYWDNYDSNSEVVFEVLFYVLLWPVQLIFKLWTLIAHPWLTLTSPAYRQHQREVEKMRRGLHGEITNNGYVKPFDEWCGDPFSGIGCPLLGCPHAGDWVSSDWYDAVREAQRGDRK